MHLGHLLGSGKEKEKGKQQNGRDEEMAKKDYLTLLSQQKQLLRRILHPTSCGAGTKLQCTVRHPGQKRLGDRAPSYIEERSERVETHGALLTKALKRPK